MPATTEQINAREAELVSVAVAIYDEQLSLAQTIEAITEADEILAASSAAKLAIVLNDRFEINNKLKYTNDDQRKIAVIELENADPQFIQTQNVRKTLITTNSNQRAEIEKNRNLHKTKLITLEYFATTPNDAPTSTPPGDTPTTTAGTSANGAIVFESAAGFSINANSIARIAGNPYFGIAIAGQALVADGKISFKLNNITDGLRVFLSEQANQFELSFVNGVNVQLRRNGAYAAEAPVVDLNSIFSFRRTGTDVKFYENEILRGTFAQASSGAARLSVTAPNEPNSIGAGINSAFIENASV